MSNPRPFARLLVDGIRLSINANRTNLLNRSRFRPDLARLQSRYITNQTENNISFQFANGFFKFKHNENQYIVSYWTPLRSLMQVMDPSPNVPDMTKVVDERHAVAYSASIPIGFVFCDLNDLTFKHPTLGLCNIQFDGNNEELIKWKEKFESELQYGSDTGIKKVKSLEDHELSFLVHQKAAIKQVFRPLQEEYQKIVALARTDARRKFKWGGLFLLSAQLGFVARLTWFEYSWDIMEPITWMLTYAMMVGTFAYYIVTSQEYLVPSVERRLTINKFWKLAQKANFDVTKFRELRHQIKQLDDKIIKIKTNENLTWLKNKYPDIYIGMPEQTKLDKN